MEEKKSLGIHLSTFFLFISIIVIIVMAFYIYIEKTNSNKEIENLEANATNMQNTINDLQDKINSISNTIGSNTSNSKENNTNTTENIQTATKEIYKRVKTKGIDKSELNAYSEIYLVLDGNSIYLSNDLSDKALEGTYTVDSANNIDYKFLNPSEDYIFYTSSNYRFEDIDGKKNIVIDNEPNGIMYYEEVN